MVVRAPLVSTVGHRADMVDALRLDAETGGDASRMVRMELAVAPHTAPGKPA
jgi:hypothetical protein